MLGYRRLSRRIVALDASNGKPLLVTLEPGVIAQVDGPARESGLIEIMCRGKTYIVFFSDLQDRSVGVRNSGEDGSQK